MGQGLYDHSFRDINNKEVRLGDFAGKKILFMILPVNPADSLIVQLKGFVAAYGNRVQVIGVLSQEDGASQATKAAINARYGNTGILLTDVLYSRKGGGQSPVMKWLTSKEENGHFDMDVKGSGHKFFINGQGKLYAVLGSNSSLLSPFVQKVMNASESGVQPVPVKDSLKS
ncbi:thioredoxin domain-containing protein [Filimonas effusa]|nr:hypothetical protein [Filimonas effusa]